MILIILLHFYLKWIYFRPMRRVLDERNAATEGARKQAEESLARAARKAEEYETALRQARTDLYREQETLRHQLREEQARSIEEARRQAHAMVKESEQQLAAELASAKESLRERTDSLADGIVQAILRRRAA